MLKLLIALLLIAMLLSLFSGLFYLVKDGGKTKRVANFLTLRVAIAVLLIALVIIGILSGQLSFNSSPIPGF